MLETKLKVVPQPLRLFGQRKLELVPAGLKKPITKPSSRKIFLVTCYSESPSGLYFFLLWSVFFVLSFQQMIDQEYFNRDQRPPPTKMKEYAAYLTATPDLDELRLSCSLKCN